MSSQYQIGVLAVANCLCLHRNLKENKYNMHSLSLVSEFKSRHFPIGIICIDIRINSLLAPVLGVNCISCYNSDATEYVLLLNKNTELTICLCAVHRDSAFRQREFNRKQISFRLWALWQTDLLPEITLYIISNYA